MLFLIDENLPTRVGSIFTDRGFSVEYVASLPELQGRPDEAIFDYAILHKAVVVTRDVGFVSFAKFPLQHLKGILLIRFPNQITIQKLCAEVTRLIASLSEFEFQQLVVVEPGLIRIRKLR